MTVPFVILGTSGLLGDYAEIIHACGGRISKIALNVPPDASHGISVEQRIASIGSHFGRNFSWPSIDVVMFDDLSVDTGTKVTLGFRSRQAPAFAKKAIHKLGVRLESLIHPAASIATSARLGEAIAINALAIVASFAHVGDCCVINRGASIGHDTRLGEAANIGPGANIASGVDVGAGVAVGMGANVLENLTIGTGSIVGAGAVVTTDVPAGVVVAGVPARIIDQRER